MKVHENLSIVSPVVQCGKTDRRTVMTMVIVPFGNFANALKNGTRTNHLAKSNIT